MAMNGQLAEARAALAWRPIPFIFVIVIVIAPAANFIFVVLTYASVASGLFLLLFLLHRAADGDGASMAIGPKKKRTATGGIRRGYAHGRVASLRRPVISGRILPPPSHTIWMRASQNQTGPAVRPCPSSSQVSAVRGRLLVDVLEAPGAHAQVSAREQGRVFDVREADDMTGSASSSMP